MAVSPWNPKYTLTPSIARGLMKIEAARALVEHTPISLAAEAELRNRARVRAAHFSTFIEGNRLTMEQAGQVIADGGVQISGRERDVAEVRNYWNALLRVEEWAEKIKPLTEELIKKLHALVEYGLRAAPTPYRDGQNAIRNNSSGALIYLPPESGNVPDLSMLSPRDRSFHERQGRNLRRTLIENGGVMPVGLLRWCLEYAKSPRTPPGGIFSAVKMKFAAEAKTSLPNSVEKVYSFRNEFIAHQEKDLLDPEQARKALKDWIGSLEENFAVSENTPQAEGA